MKKLINKYSGLAKPTIYRVVFEDDQGALLEYENAAGATNRIWTVSLSSYEEYKEPRRLEGWVNIYEDSSGLCFGVVQKSEDSASKATHLLGAKKRGTVKFEWVEGQT